MWVLSILQQSPKKGAEIMDQIEIATQGWWRPSPGSVYPLLDELQKEEASKNSKTASMKLLRGANKNLSGHGACKRGNHTLWMKL